MASDIVLKIQNLSISYPQGFRAEKVIINNLNLEIRRGGITGFLGPNGAGKTTLIKGLIGLINIKGGSISFFGEHASAISIKGRIGYMPEIANYYWFLTPEEILKMFGRICGIDKKALNERIDSVLKTVGLVEQKRQLIKTFSKGMENRLNIAQALLHDPEFLILDEPFSGLDPLGRIHARNIFKELKERQKTILISSHELSEAELICDHICIIKNGTILKYGPLEEVLSQQGEHNLERYFIKMIGEVDE